MDSVIKLIKNDDYSTVDKSLIAMFLKMSPEERLQMNDNSLSTILELRYAFEQQRHNKSGIKLNT
jgi:hypothetical protein